MGLQCECTLHSEAPPWLNGHFQDDNSDNVDDVNDILNKCVKHDNLGTIDSTCKSVASVKTEIVIIKSKVIFFIYRVQIKISYFFFQVNNVASLQSKIVSTYVISRLMPYPSMFIFYYLTFYDLFHNFSE